MVKMQDQSFTKRNIPAKFQLAIQIRLYGGVQALCHTTKRIGTDDHDERRPPRPFRAQESV
jgi:hypothetical protein